MNADPIIKLLHLWLEKFPGESLAVRNAMGSYFVQLVGKNLLQRRAQLCTNHITEETSIRKPRRDEAKELDLITHMTKRFTQLVQ